MNKFMTTEEVIKRLSQFPPDTPIVGFVGAPDSLMGRYGFIPTQSDWLKVVDAFDSYSKIGFDQVWDAFADAKMDVLSDWFCDSCNNYSYTCESRENVEILCDDCWSDELDNNTISN